MCELRRDIFRIRKTHDVVNSLDRALSLQWERAVVFVFGKLFVNESHLIVGLVGIGHAVYGGRVEQVLGLVGVEYVG